jgi:hypothetical protein
MGAMRQAFVKVVIDQVSNGQEEELSVQLSATRHFGWGLSKVVGRKPGVS